MDVAAYIKELLYREHYIYVPGLGSFLMRKTSGIYNKEQHCFYPPKNSIDFVAEEKQDYELEKYISLQKNISTNAALYFIEKYVDQLKNDSANKNLPIKEVFFPAKDNMQISGKSDTAINAENFGLPVIPFLALKKEPVLVENEVVPVDDVAENFYKEFSKNISQEDVKPKSNTVFWGSIILLLAVCFLGCYTLYVYYPDVFSRFTKQQSEQSNQSINLSPTIVPDTLSRTTVTSQDSLKEAARSETVVDTTVATGPVAKPVTKPRTQKVVPAAKSPEKIIPVQTEVTDDPDLVNKSAYEIIGASFKTIKGAKTFVNQLKQKGMQAKILKNTSGNQKLITFGSFSNKETAQNALEKLRAKDVHSEAYIQHYK